MEQYISKDALVAEIEKLTDDLYGFLPDASKVENGTITISEACNTGKYTALDSFRNYINTIEVKEANEALRTEYEKGRADTIKEFQDALVNHQGHTTKDYKKKDINFISDKEYLDRAIDFIVDREEENDYICEKLHEIPEEIKICSEDCQNLDHWCILRFLKHYKIKHLYESN